MSILVENSPLIRPQSQPTGAGSPVKPKGVSDHAPGPADCLVEDVILSKSLTPEQSFDAESANQALNKVASSIAQDGASLEVSLDPERVKQLLSL
jgi:hypothetical protein